MRNVIIALFAILAGCTQQEPPAPAPAGAPPPNESAAVATLKEVTKAQTEYFQRNRRYALDYDELISARFLSEEPSGSKTGYEFRMRPAADAASYTITATPFVLTPPNRHLFSDQTGEIRAELDKDATRTSPII